MPYRKRNLDHPSRAKIAAHVARMHGVTVEHLLETIRRRKAFRRARMFRRKSRKKHLEKYPKANRLMLLPGQAVYSDEGELHVLLRVFGLTAAEFCQIVGIQESVFHHWFGNPLHPWPVEFLRYYGWAKNMADFLASKGWDPAQFKPKIPERTMPATYHIRNPSDLVLVGLTDEERTRIRERWERECAKYGKRTIVHERAVTDKDTKERKPKWESPWKL